MNRIYNETATVTKSELILKIGNIYWYKVNGLRKKGMNFILRYPIEKELGFLKRINDNTFYGKTRMVRPKRVKK